MFIFLTLTEAANANKGEASCQSYRSGQGKCHVRQLTYASLDALDIRATNIPEHNSGGSLKIVMSSCLPPNLELRDDDLKFCSP